MILRAGVSHKFEDTQFLESKIFRINECNFFFNGEMKSDCDMLRRLPDLVLFTKVFTYFNFTDYALTSYI